MARVLVAEDDGLTRRFIEETLEFAGHEVTSASNGAEAINGAEPVAQDAEPAAEAAAEAAPAQDGE